MMPAAEIQEYRRNACGNLKKAGTGPNVGRLAGVAVLTGRAIRAQWLPQRCSDGWAAQVGICHPARIASRCTVVVETGILAKSLTAAAHLAGQPEMIGGIAGSDVGFRSAILHCRTLSLAFSVLLEMLIRRLGPVAARIRSENTALSMLLPRIRLQCQDRSRTHQWRRDHRAADCGCDRWDCRRFRRPARGSTVPVVFSVRRRHRRESAD